jgi:hypothetical protein
MAEAVPFAERAARGSDDPGVLDVLAAAYAEAGRFPDAVAIARRAVAKSDAAPLKARLASYESGVPFHETRQ